MSQSYVCLHYHLVFSIKNRAPAITVESQGGFDPISNTG